PEQMQRNLDGRDGKYTYLPKEGLLFPQLLHRQPITSFLTFLNADDLVVQSKRICREDLEPYLRVNYSVYSCHSLNFPKALETAYLIL
ncbi:MAG: hypothetical protein K8L99_32700, partial [Anaerolineae bacterium]|nr:hypothetical protein [Anaerolineae bacterium]